MLLQLELTNFMSVEYAVMSLTEGLNVIRGANEAGKSTRFQAVAYALWGARGLTNTLEEVVTWGKPPSSLKVKLSFMVNGVSYTVVRSKSGAELTGGATASGQSEVTKQVELLLGASMTTGLATLLSNQGALQGSLDSSSIALIENLSDMALIDRLIAGMQTNLACGSTKLLEAQLESYRELTQPEADFTEYVAAIKEAAHQLDIAEQAHNKAVETEFSCLALSTDAATEISAIKVETATREALEKRVVTPPPMPQPPVEVFTLDELERRRDAALQDEQTRGFWKLFQTLPARGAGIKFETLKGETHKAEADCTTLTVKLTDLRIKRAQLEAKGIYDESCQLCGKLLTEVPEVVTINQRVAAALDALDVDIRDTETCYASAARLAVNLRERLQLTEDALQTVNRLGGYVKVDGDYCPPCVIWTGPAISDQPDLTDYSLLVKAWHSRKSIYERELQTVQAVRDQQDLIHSELAKLPAPRKIEPYLEILMRYQGAQVARAAADRTLQEKKAKLNEAGIAKTNAEAVYKLKMQDYANAVSNKAALQSTLDEYRANNALIAKLRTVRPSLAKELWSLVLHSVSTVFSQMRGVNSVVGRDSNKFTIDSKPASSYSGSTKDILGLAVRVALQKTFLGNVDFCLLDEPAAGCDAERELALLTAITRAGYAQVLLVTHSELADTLAANILVI